ncbi:DUF6282 family protein [Legionella drancourtii]|uniref:Amidohydrolase-related domain-containing protein n=1 Tax=Legionella drancourtii LLAP12 TaxID=658187 RepID=G9ESC5_9GAMM|nr:DUF6282 family protein [Legionella drancourtii]EHL29906.1 hypothetical protein LDG_8198 [Legionella drancourtii LLAP12]
MKLTEYTFIDIHYHASPDLYERRWHALKAGQIYQSLNGAVFLTSHLGGTSVQATLAQKLGLPVFPSLVLNHLAGGINYRVILHALNEYQPVTAAKMLVHFPTITGRHFPSKLSRQLINPNLSQYSQHGETLFNRQKKLRKNAIDILKMANDYPIVLTTGHASAEEIYSLIDACITYNVPALLLNQPAHPLVNLNAAALNELVKNEFVWVEQTVLTYLLGHQDKEDFTALLTTTPRVIYSSDLGQTNQMDIENWLDYSNTLFAELQLSPQRKTDLICSNAAKLLTL